MTKKEQKVFNDLQNDLFNKFIDFNKEEAETDEYKISYAELKLVRRIRKALLEVNNG